VLALVVTFLIFANRNPSVGSKNAPRITTPRITTPGGNPTGGQAESKIDDDLASLYHQIKTFADENFKEEFRKDWKTRFFNAKSEITFVDFVDVNGFPPRLKVRVNKNWPLPYYYLCFVALEHTIQEDDFNSPFDLKAKGPFVFFSSNTRGEPVVIDAPIYWQRIYARSLRGISKDTKPDEFEDFKKQLTCLLNYYKFHKLMPKFISLT
jgi:hypothetical protein